MARKSPNQWIPYENPAAERAEETPGRKSRSQKKRESTAMQDLGEALAALPLRELARLPMKPELLAAFRELPRIRSHEARRRQVQYIGRLVREEEDENREILQKALDLFREGLSPSAALRKEPDEPAGPPAAQAPTPEGVRDAR